jgi:hypothetical protein
VSNVESQEFAQRIEVIETAYEYMLAYAAQGYEAIHEAQQNNDIRTHLESMADALEGLGEVASTLAALVDKEKIDGYQDFLAALLNDAKKTQGAVRLTLARSGISSQLIDNLNASIHVRALLTDLFLLDEALKN